MNLPSPFDTPPNGDFARYVDELTRQSAARLGLHQAMSPSAPPQAGPLPKAQAGAPAASRPSAATASTARGQRAERAERAKPATAARPPATAPQPAQRPSLAAAPPVEAFRPLLQLFKHAVVLWLAYAIATAIYPPISVIGWPLLLLFLIWAGIRVKSLPWADLGRAMRMGMAEAEQAARQKKN